MPRGRVNSASRPDPVRHRGPFARFRKINQSTAPELDHYICTASSNTRTMTLDGIDRWTDNMSYEPVIAM